MYDVCWNEVFEAFVGRESGVCVMHRTNGRSVCSLSFSTVYIRYIYET
jgi:hypothetical protein